MNEKQKEYIKSHKYRPIPLLDGIEEIKNDFEERLQQGDTTYGIEILDEAVETIRKGSMTFIIAAPNTGKSLCGLNIAVHLAKQNKKVLICSCEMGAGLLMERQLKSLLGIGMKELRSLYENERDTANTLMDKLREDKSFNYLNNIDICETGGATVEEIIEMLNAFPEFEYIVIDYIQRVRGIGSDYEIISNAARELQTFARETKRKLIVCSQAGRASTGEAQGNKNNKNNILDPSKIRGKGSGSIEEDADVGISLMEDPNNTGQEKRILITLFKNRYGSIKNITYTYIIDNRLNLKLIKRGM